MPGRLLHGGPGAEVEVAAGHARRTAVDRCLLQQQHPRPGASGLQGGASAGDAEPDDDHVVRLGVGRYVGGGDGRGDRQSSRHGHGPNVEHVSVWGDPRAGERTDRLRTRAPTTAAEVT